MTTDGATVPSPGEAAAVPALRRAARRGSVWTITSYAVAQVLRFISNVVLTRVLYEEAFALMALVNAVLQGLTMFSDFGLGPNVIQNARGDQARFLNTVFTLQVLRGVLLAGLAVLLAYPFAAFYAAADPAAGELTYLLPLAAVSVLLAGFQSTRIYTAGRHLALGRIAVIDLVSQTLAIAATITFAVWQRDVVALVFGAITGSGVKMMLSHLWLPGPVDRFGWERESARSILGFGKWIFFSTAVTFFALQSDRLLLARWLPLADVGVYAVAASVAVMGPTVLGTLQLSVAFPLYSRMLARGASLQQEVARTQRWVHGIGGWIVAAMIAGAVPFVALVYDARWQDAGWMIAVLAIGAWCAMIDGMYGAALLAAGHARFVAVTNLTKVVVLFLSFPLGVHWFGVAGAVAVFVLSDAIKLLVGMWGASRQGILLLKNDLVMTAWSLGLGVGCWAALRWSGVQAKPLIALPIVAVVSTSMLASIVVRARSTPVLSGGS